MTTPVSFELSKLLKEKWFDEPCRYVHDTWNNIEDWLEDGDGEHRNSHKNGSVYYSAPTIAEVVMWLYDKHGIWISVVRNDTKDLFNYVITWHNGICENESRGKGYQIPTEAYEAAIKYTLENIIKQ